MSRRDYFVTVCSECLRASCWHGEDLCDKSRNAGTVDRLASALDALHHEHPDHYSIAKLLKVCGTVRMADIPLRRKA